MPANYIKGELDFCQREFSNSTPEVKLLHVKNGLVSIEGFVYDNMYKVNQDSLFDPAHYSDRFNFKHYAKKVLLKYKRSLPAGKKYLLAFDESSDFHYHWICEVMPRIYAIRERLQDYTLLLPDEASYIRNVGLKLLEFSDLLPAGIEFIKSNELVKVKDLSIVTHTSYCGHMNDVLISQLRDRLMMKMNLIKSCKGKRKKIYITRENAAYRKILNEKEVMQVMKDFDYSICHFEDMTPEQQINVAADADCLVSIHGAGLTNMFFMPPGSKVLEFRRDEIFHNQCYWHLADSLGHRYYYLFGKPDNDNLVIEGKGCNLTIDINKLKQVLLKMED